MIVFAAVLLVIPRADGPLNGDQQLVLNAFAPRGVAGEGLNQQLRIVALDIGPGANLAAVKELCVDGESGGRWYDEEDKCDARAVSI